MLLRIDPTPFEFSLKYNQCLRLNHENREIRSLVEMRVHTPVAIPESSHGCGSSGGVSAGEQL